MNSSIWHPFTQHQTSPLPITLVKGEGSWLWDDQGKRYLDLISSWWVNIHGHAHPAIATALYQQASTLEHTLLAGFSHPAAHQLANALIEVLPEGFERVFYSDNGSTAVEVALKMAYQYWFNQHQETRTRFIALKGGYHGDTFGAMSVGKASGFFAPFSQHLFQVDFIDVPETYIGVEHIEQQETQVLEQFKALLNTPNANYAAIILEPLVQGAGGMKMMRPDFLNQLCTLAHQNNILIIFDEVMTGFGRTGTLFACQQISPLPDIICLSKGLTGGFMPLSVTVTTGKIFNAFLGPDFSNCFAHGHSYTGNPLGCAVALASLQLFKTENTLEKINTIQNFYTHHLVPKLLANNKIEKIRVTGSILAFDVNSIEKGYGSAHSKSIATQLVEAGLLLRPLGNTLYLMPPYCTAISDLTQASDTLLKIISV